MSKLISPLGDLYIKSLNANDLGANNKIELQELRPQVMTGVKAWPDTLAAVNNILKPLTAKGCDVLNVGAGQFLIIDWSGIAIAEITSIGGDIAAVTEVSHSRSVVRVSGEAAPRLLMKGVAIDMDLAVTSVGTALQSSIHGIGIIVHRKDANSFTILCNRGFSQSFWHWLSDEGAEFGVKILPSQF